MLWSRYRVWTHVPIKTSHFTFERELKVRRGRGGDTAKMRSRGKVYSSLWNTGFLINVKTEEVASQQKFAKPAKTYRSAKRRQTGIGGRCASILTGESFWVPTLCLLFGLRKKLQQKKFLSFFAFIFFLLFLLFFPLFVLRDSLQCARLFFQFCYWISHFSRFSSTYHFPKNIFFRLQI